MNLWAPHQDQGNRRSVFLDCRHTRAFGREGCSLRLAGEGVFQSHDRLLTVLRVHPTFGVLHSDPRFARPIRISSRFGRMLIRIYPSLSKPEPNLRNYSYYRSSRPTPTIRASVHFFIRLRDWCFPPQSNAICRYRRGIYRRGVRITRRWPS